MRERVLTLTGLHQPADFERRFVGLSLVAVPGPQKQWWRLGTHEIQTALIRALSGTHFGPQVVEAFMRFLK